MTALKFLAIYFFCIGLAKLIYAVILYNRKKRNNHESEKDTD